jgi:hypothetical protein
MTDLLPCPFCKFVFDSKRIDMADVLYPSGRMWRVTEAGVAFIPRKDKQEGDRDVWTMRCPTHYGGCGVSVKGLSDLKAMEAWNRRASPWRPMSECPDDATRVFVMFSDGVATDLLSRAAHAQGAIAWMPIPKWEPTT